MYHNVFTYNYFQFEASTTSHGIRTQDGSYFNRNGGSSNGLRSADSDRNGDRSFSRLDPYGSSNDGYYGTGRGYQVSPYENEVEESDSPRRDEYAESRGSRVSSSNYGGGGGGSSDTYDPYATQRGGSGYSSRYDQTFNPIFIGSSPRANNDTSCGGCCMTRCMAEKGSRGPPGSTGPQGEKGQQGFPGNLPFLN